MYSAHCFTIFEPKLFYLRLMEVYNWQKKEWPHFTFTENAVEKGLYAFAEKTGMVSGALKAFPEELRLETLVSIRRKFLNLPETMLP